MAIIRFAETQKIRLISESLNLLTTVGAVRNGLGVSYSFNAATQKSIDALEFVRSGAGIAEQCTCGISGIWEGIPVQVDLV